MIASINHCTMQCRRTLAALGEAAEWDGDGDGDGSGSDGSGDDLHDGLRDDDDRSNYRLTSIRGIRSRK